MKLAAAQQLGWRLLQRNGAFTVVGYDRQKATVFIDRTHSGLTGFNAAFPSRMDAPLKLGDVLRLRILVDRCSVELFAENGRVAMSSLVFPPADATGIEAYSSGGPSGPVSAILSALRSTY
jgi:sucrose-6-phosphate hydrolase SacC (GH32 family)